MLKVEGRLSTCGVLDNLRELGLGRSSVGLGACRLAGSSAVLGAKTGVPACTVFIGGCRSCVKTLVGGGLDSCSGCILG